jgi:hypothetical protein
MLLARRWLPGHQLMGLLPSQLRIEMGFEMRHRAVPHCGGYEMPSFVAPNIDLVNALPKSRISAMSVAKAGRLG